MNAVRTNWQLWPGVLGDEAVERIINLASDAEPQQGSLITDSVVDNKIRSSTVRWLFDDELQDVLFRFVTEANTNAFGMNVSNYAEMQFTEYHASQGGHYDWHHDVDWNGTRAADRKLSITVQLSDPSEYTGGDFEFGTCETPKQDVKLKGTVLVFPSYLDHRVLPVTSGVRKSLVAWFHGPRWR